MQHVYLHALQKSVCERPEVGKCCDTNHEDHDHDAQLEVGVKSGCKDLRRC